MGVLFIIAGNELAVKPYTHTWKLMVYVMLFCMGARFHSQPIS